MSASSRLYLEQQEREEYFRIDFLSFQDQCLLSQFVNQSNKAKEEGIWQMKEHNKGEEIEIHFEDFCHGLVAPIAT